MRFVDRASVEEPEILKSKKAEQAKQSLRDYLNQAEDIRHQTRMRFDVKLYNNSEVKVRLKELFDDKCAYCESYVNVTSYGDTEHFRPKQNAGNDMKSTQLEYYSWLAYEWENLYLSCSKCNHNKQNFFPVEGERGPLGASIGELRHSENAHIIDPCFDSPMAHLNFGFNGQVYARSKKGEKTISILDLNREALVDHRKRRCDSLFSALEENPYYYPIMETGSENPPEKFCFNDLEYAGAMTNAILNIQQGEQTNLSEFLSTLNRMNEDERRAVLQDLKSYNVEDSFKLEKAGWSLGRAIEGIGKVFSSKQKHGEVFRSRILDEMKTAEHNVGRIKIQNFKILKDLEISIPEKAETKKDNSEGNYSENYEDPGLAPCLMLLGENATGKSSILEAIALALIGSEHANRLIKLVDDDDISPKGLIYRPDLSKWDKTATEDLSVVVELRGSDTEAKIIGSGSSSRFTGTKDPSKIVLGYGARRYFDKKSRFKSSTPHRIVSLFNPLSTIADPESWLLKQDKDFAAITRALKDILLLDRTSKFIKNDDGIAIEIDGQETKFKHLSVGYKSVVTLAVDIMRELLVHYDNLEQASAVVLVDEIENHLHPRWKILIMQKLREAMPKVQFIVTTHDPLCLRGMYDGEIFVLRRAFDEKKDIYSGPPEIHPLTVMPGMDSDDILTSAGFGLTTTFLDETIEDDISEYSQLLLLQNRKILDDEALDEEDSMRLDRIRRRLVGTVTGFGASPIEEAVILEKLDETGTDSTLDMPSNFEKIIAEAYKATKNNHD